MATMEAPKLPSTKTPNAEPDRKVLAVLSEDRGQLIRRLRGLPPSDIRSMSRMHRIVRHFAHDFATDAWTLLCRRDPVAVSGILLLSPAESFRFLRAFYRVELFLQFARHQQGGSYPQDFPYWQFFSMQPAEVVEQVACVHDFLEERFAQGR